MKNKNIINEITRVKNLMGISLINEQVSKIGCNRYDQNSINRKLCSKLNTSSLKSIMFPLLSKMLEGKKRLWSQVIPKEDQEYLFNTLKKLQSIDSSKKWQWPCKLNDNEICYGTLEEFKRTALSELSFIYSEESKWEQLNKLDTNYTDTAVLITDIIDDSKTLNSEEILNDLNKNNKESLKNAINLISKHSELIYNRYLKDGVKYVQSSIHNSKEGEEVEKLIVNTMTKNGFKLIHPIQNNVGQGGDPIDVLLGVDLIMESPDGEIVTIQCKKVWNIEKLSIPSNNNKLFKITGTPYVSKQRNLDYVAYGTKDGKVIVAKRQNEIIKKGDEFITGSKKMLPTPQKDESDFFIYPDSVITTNLKND